MAKVACPDDLSGGSHLPEDWTCSPTQLEIRVGYMRATLEALKVEKESLRVLMGIVERLGNERNRLYLGDIDAHIKTLRKRLGIAPSKT